MKTCHPPRPRRNRGAECARATFPRATGAFTLIELLIVVGIIALLAGLVAYLLPSVTVKQVRGRLQGERAAIEVAIKLYKEKVGFYPPDNPNPDLTDRSLLYYELIASNPPPVVTNFMGATGIANSGDVERKFHEHVKPSAHGPIPGSPNAQVFLVPYKGTNGEFNAWHYSSSNPRHNTESFDLWAVVVIAGKTNVFGNWKD